MRGLSLVAASGGHSSSRCAGLSLSGPLLLRSTSSRHAGSVVVAHGPSCSVACGIFPDQGSNPCPLHWQADSQPLRHQGSPTFFLSAHRTFSRIDHILGHKSNLGKFKKIEIISSIFSDHNALRLEVNYRKKTVKHTNTWKLNSVLLNNQEIPEEIKEEIKKIPRNK